MDYYGLVLKLDDSHKYPYGWFDIYISLVYLCTDSYGCLDSCRFILFFAHWGVAFTDAKLNYLVTTTAIDVWGVSLGASSTSGPIYLTSSIQPEPFGITVTPVIDGTTAIFGATTTTAPGTTVVWGGLYTYVEPDETETVGGSTSIIGGTTLAPTAITVTPNPYPTTVPSKRDTLLNLKTASWTSGTPQSPTSRPRCIGCGHPCILFCDPNCPFCPPNFFGSSNDNDNEDESKSSTTSVPSATVLFGEDTDDEFPATYAAFADLSNSMYPASTTTTTPTTATASTVTIADIISTTTIIPTATFTATCAFWDEIAAYEFEIYDIVVWATDGGSSLKTQELGCGALTFWKWVPAIATVDAYVHFYLPIIISSRCVERAIVSAGGPKISCVGGGAAKRSVEARTPAGAMYLPMTEEEMEVILDVYGNATDGILHQYTPMDWSATNSSTTTTLVQ